MAINIDGTLSELKNIQITIEGFVRGSEDIADFYGKEYLISVISLLVDEAIERIEDIEKYIEKLETEAKRT